MTRLLLVALAALGAGCSFGGESSEASRADRCVERVLSRVDREHLTARRRPVTERYLRETYCDRFAREGWVNADGTLSIDAHRWLMNAGTSDCGTARAGEEARTIPCPPEADPTLDCALLHHVRRDEVRAYLRQLERTPQVELECDDGTPLDELGVG